MVSTCESPFCLSPQKLLRIQASASEEHGDSSSHLQKYAGCIGQDHNIKNNKHLIINVIISNYVKVFGDR